jgi:reductive dehalogenase
MKFHSTVSRRDFMKALGLTGAGVAAIAGITPTFHDLDEVISSEPGNVSHPWWVTNRDHYDPTVEIDWNELKKPFKMDTSPYSFGYIGGYTEFRNQGRKPGILGNIPGRRHKEYALMYASRVMRSPNPWNTFLGPKVGPSPEELEVPKWTGTPEEASRMIRAAFQYLGSPKVGFLEVNDKTSTLIQTGRARFEDVAEPYVDNKVKVVPEKAKWMIVALVRQPFVMTQWQGDPDGDEMDHYPAMQCGSHIGYGFSNLIMARFLEFLHVLGAVSVGDPGLYNIGAGVVSGIMELGRLNHGITPEWGPIVRKNDCIITDLPLPPSKPVDAGITSFCETCAICAEICPTESLSLEKEPTWDMGTNTLWNRQGVKKWPHNYQTCKGCPFCDTHCVFSQKNLSSIHDIVKATLANTTLFNGFFAQMDRTFGYGHKNNYDDWWSRDLDTYRFDNIPGASTPPGY